MVSKRAGHWPGTWIGSVRDSGIARNGLKPLGRDNRFRSIKARDLTNGREDDTSMILTTSAVLLMFSVFEANVRDQARIDVKNSLPEQLHPAVDHAVHELQETYRKWVASVG